MAKKVECLLASVWCLFQTHDYFFVDVLSSTLRSDQ